MFKKRISRNATTIKELRNIHKLAVKAYDYLLWEESSKAVERVLDTIILKSNTLINKLEEENECEK